MNDRTARRRSEALEAFAVMMAIETEDEDYRTMAPAVLEELAYRHFYFHAERADDYTPFWFWTHVLDLCSPWLRVETVR